MKTNLNKLFVAFLILQCAFFSNAQVASMYTFTQFQGSYSAISGGSVFSTPTSDDENYVDPAFPAGQNGNVNGPGIPIGFNFMFNNYTFDRIGISTNGYIMLGNSAQGNTAVQVQTNDWNRPISMTSTSPPANQNRISALGNDIFSQPTSNIRVETVGAFPTRTFVVQWTDFRRFTSVNAVGDTLNFQIKLYETTNIVDVIYGTMKSVTEDTVAQIGLRGNSNADFNNRSVTGSLTWATSVAGTANNFFARYNTTLFPFVGQTYRWTPPQCSGTLASLTPTGLAFVCPGGTSTISLNNPYTVSGITYTWTTANGNLGPFTIIPGANDPLYVTPIITQPIWYQALSTCLNSGLTTTSSPFQVQVAGATSSTVPYYEGFEAILAPDQLPNCSWAISNPNVTQTYTSGTTFNRIPKTGAKFASFKAPTSSTGDYFYTNAIQLNTGVTYSAALNYITDGLPGWSELSILTGTAQAAASLTNIVTESPVIGTSYKLLSYTFTVPNSGQYYMAVKAIGSANPKYLSWDDISVTVPCLLNPVNMFVTPSSPSVCTGQNISISAFGASTYSWNTGATGSLITVSPGANSVYYVTGTNSLSGCSKTQMQSITVYQSPPVTISSSTGSLCAGKSATLYALGANSYNWSHGGNNYFTVVTPANTSTYLVNGSNANCSANAMYTVTVLPAPTINVTSNRPGTACVGDNIVIQATGAVSYQWSSPSAPVMQGTSVTVQPPTTTTYVVTGTNNNGCTGSATIVQKVMDCVGIAEVIKESLFTLYPNPANDQLTIVALDKTGGNYAMYDLTGRVVKTGVLHELSTISITELASGVYYFKLTVGNTTEITKVVKQ